MPGRIGPEGDNLPGPRVREMSAHLAPPRLFIVERIRLSQ